MRRPLSTERGLSIRLVWATRGLPCCVVAGETLRLDRFDASVDRLESWCGQFEPSSELKHRSAHALVLERLPVLEVLQHRSLVGTDREPALQAPLERHWQGDLESRGYGGDLLEGAKKHCAHRLGRAKLDQGGAGQHRHGVEGGVSQELEPDLVAQIALD